MPLQDAARVLVVGASAAGKTTLGHALAALMKALLRTAAGAARIDG